MNEPLKILMLEDSKTDAELVQRHLLKNYAACIFHVAMTKQDFIAALENFKPDIILADNSLPQFNARQALTMVREQQLPLPFIMVTGTVSEEFAASIIKNGADDYILKQSLIRLPAAIDAALKFRSAEKEKKLTDERLRQSEENYRTIMERVSDAFVAIDKNWNYTYINKQAGEIMRRDPAELTGKNIWTEFPGSVGNVFYHAYHQSLHSQQYLHLEEYYPAFDSWLENHIYPSPEGLSIFFRNITERKKAEQLLIQSEANLKAIFDNASEGFVLLDDKCYVKSFNDRARNAIPHKQGHELTVNSNLFDFVEKDRIAYLQSVVKRTLDGEIVQYDRSHLDKEGRFRWINFLFNAVCRNNETDGICITARDITEIKVAEQQKEFDHSNLHALINNTNDLMWSVDLDFKLITANHAFNVVTKLMTNRIPARGSNILEAAFNEKQSTRYKEFYERAFTGEIFTVIEHNDIPVEFWSEISFYPIYEGKSVVGTACFARDITERKRAEEELKKSNERFQYATKATSDILWELNFESKTYRVHEGQDKLFGIESEMDWQAGIDAGYIIEEDREMVRKSFGEARRDPSRERWHMEYRVYSIEKEVLHIVNHAIFIRNENGKVKRAIGAITDVTEQKNLEQQLQLQQEAEQFKITGAILQAQQDERALIGAELHDNVNQILVGTNLVLSMAQSKAGGTVARIIETAMNNLQSAIRENRKIAHELVGPDFELDSLMDQLQQLAGSMLVPLGMQVDFDKSSFDENTLTEKQKLAVYRIAQEQCTNIVKYARATKVSIIISANSSLFEMIISDNGVGMDNDKKSIGIGLRNISGRVSMFDGTASVVTLPGKGFTLEICFPL